MLEDAIGVRNLISCSINIFQVLILVVLEDAIGVSLQRRPGKNSCVLILVVLEDAIGGRIHGQDA